MRLSRILAGGDRRSLGRTQEVVQLVLADRKLLAELFDCLVSPDETVRMRSGDALEKICRQKPQWLEPYKYRLFNELPHIRQASVQWHLAQIFSEIALEASEKKEALEIMKNNLKTTDDWIVTNLTLDSLAVFVRNGALEPRKFKVILEEQLKSAHKSVVSKANKLLNEFKNG